MKSSNLILHHKCFSKDFLQSSTYKLKNEIFYKDEPKLIKSPFNYHLENMPQTISLKKAQKHPLSRMNSKRKIGRIINENLKDRNPLLCYLIKNYKKIQLFSKERMRSNSKRTTNTNIFIKSLNENYKTIYQQQTQKELKTLEIKNTVNILTKNAPSPIISDNLEETKEITIEPLFVSRQALRSELFQRRISEESTILDDRNAIMHDIERISTNEDIN